MPDTRLDAGAAEQLEQVRQLQMLLELSRQVSALDSLDAVLDVLVGAAIQEIGAEAGSLFVHDDETGELYTQKSSDLGQRQIRVMDDRGIAGAVYQSGLGEIVPDAYADPRFAREVDQETGFTTKSILCAPVKNAKGETIGVVEILNKTRGDFDERDLALLEGMTSQCAITLQSMQLLDRMTQSRRREIEFLNLVSELTSELELGRLLGKVMSEATRMLDAERSTLFLNDEKTGELFSFIGDKLETEIRFPNQLGIAGTVFTTGESIRIPYAYADLRFNPAFDRQTGYFTRSILCVPVFNKAGKPIGVTQALNRRGGPFTGEDESRLRAFTAQVAAGLENAKLFADVQAMKNYNESMLESMSNGVITFDEEGIAQTCNAAAARILRREEPDVVGGSSKDLFGDENHWLRERMQRVAETLATELTMDAELRVADETVSANVTVLPLLAADGAHLGTMVMIEDISTEKRVKSTLSRYMDPDLADRLLSADAGEEILGGTESIASVLFSDVRSFTTIAEQLGPHGTVAMLNDYFERMVACISAQSGMLDKFIGDAIMAVFGLPIAADDDEDRALRAAIAMIRSLREWNLGARAARRACHRHGRRHQHRLGRGRQHRQLEADGLHDHRRRRQPRRPARERLQAVRRADPAVRADPGQAEGRLPPARGRQGDRQGQDDACGGLRVPRLPRGGLVPEPDGDRRRVHRGPGAIPGGRLRAGVRLVPEGAGRECGRQALLALPRPVSPAAREPTAGRMGRRVGDVREVGQRPRTARAVRPRARGGSMKEPPRCRREQSLRTKRVTRLRSSASYWAGASSEPPGPSRAAAASSRLPRRCRSRSRPTGSWSRPRW